MHTQIVSLESFPAPPPAVIGVLVVGVIIFLVFFVAARLIGRSLARWERRRAIEAEMRQAVQDADDQQRIAQKLLRQYRG